MDLEQNDGVNVGATHASPETQPGSRKNTRLMRPVYSQSGYYYVTVCTHQRKQLLGQVIDDTVSLTSLGLELSRVINAVPNHFENWTLDCFVVMPNHVHVVFVCRWGTELVLGTSGPEHSSLAAVVGSFKAATSKEARRQGLIGADTLWQRGYYDHVIRDEEDLNRIREYILYNPRQWSEDHMNPLRSGRDAFEEWLARKDELPAQAFRFSGDACVAPTKDDTLR
jgi:putative transposase